MTYDNNMAMKFLYKEDLEMAIEKQYLSDVAAILSHRHDNGADLWAINCSKDLPFPLLIVCFIFWSLECHHKSLF